MDCEKGVAKNKKTEKDGRKRSGGSNGAKNKRGAKY